MKTFWYGLLLSSSLFACGEATESNQKGDEESPLVDGKEDSFFRPTQHGQLSFELENRASVTEEETYHAWEFTLSDAAKLELKTVLGTRNLDTVMYLYRRDSTEETWGRYVEKNDDYRGEIWSQIDGEFQAGQYRVIVKPFKTRMTGNFHVAATCEGDGCPGANVCQAESRLPADTGYGASCARAIFDVLSSVPENSNTIQVGVEEKCSLPDLTQTAVNHYIAYWDEVAGFEELFGFDGSISLNIETTSYRSGTLFRIDTGGDEDGMYLIYSKSDELIGLYQDNQSPDDRFYCREDGESELEAPSCFSESLYSYRQIVQKGDFLQGVASVESVNQGEGLVPEYVELAVKAYAREYGLSEGSIRFISIIHEDGQFSGADVEVWDFEGVLEAARYVFSNNRIMMSNDERGVRYICE